MFEGSFKALDGELASLVELTKKVTKAVGSAQAASRRGDLQAVNRQVESCGSALNKALSQVELVRRALEQAQQALSTSSLEDLAREVGERVDQPWLPTENPNIFVAFPALVHFAREGVRIDRKIFRSQRPSAIAEAIKRARAAKSKETDPQAVLQLIWKAARIAAGYLRKRVEQLPNSISVAARDVFEVLHLNNSDYTEAEFTRHLYLLDRNPINSVDGYRLIFSASTGTRSGRCYRIRDERGEEHIYYLLEFERL